MSWGDQDRGRWEYLTVGPYQFPHQRDHACNELCEQDGAWHMHSSDVDRRTGCYFAIMCRWIKQGEDA